MNTTTLERPKRTRPPAELNVRPDNTAVQHIAKNPYEPPSEAGKKLGIAPSTVSYYRWHMKKNLDYDLPFPSAKKHKKFLKEQQTAETQEAEKAKFPYPHKTLAEVDPIMPEVHEMKEQEAPTLPMPKHDPVNYPSHYVSGGIEAIDYIKAKLTDDEFAGYCKGNALKYLSRAGKKNDPTEDLSKARWYLDRLLAVREPSISGDQGDDASSTGGVEGA